MSLPVVNQLPIIYLWWTIDRIGNGYDLALFEGYNKHCLYANAIISSENDKISEIVEKNRIVYYVKYTFK